MNSTFFSFALVQENAFAYILYGTSRKGVNLLCVEYSYEVSCSAC